MYLSSETIWLDHESFFFYLLVAIVVLMVAAFGGLGYLIASRKVKQPFLRFFARYGVSFLCLFFLEFSVLSLQPSFHALTRNLAATAVGKVLSLADVSHTVSGSTIFLESPPLSFSIDVACLGGLLLWVYIALVLAEFKASIKQRLIGIFVGLAILIAFNFFRITTSIYLEWRTGVYVHDYFYLFNMVFVLLLWAGWIRSLRSGRELDQGHV